MITTNQHPLTFQRSAIPDVLIMPRPMPAWLAGTGLQYRITAFPSFFKIATAHVILPGISSTCLNVLAHKNDLLKQIIDVGGSVYLKYLNHFRFDNTIYSARSSQLIA